MTCLLLTVDGKYWSNFHLEFGNGSSFVITLACNTDVQWSGDILAILSKPWMLDYWSWYWVGSDRFLAFDLLAMVVNIFGLPFF